MPEEMQKSETVGVRLKRLIQAKKLDKLSYREWRERLQKHGQAPSEATISRDLRWDAQKIPIQRLELWAKAIGTPLNQLINREALTDQMRQPKPPSRQTVQSVRYWAFCPYTRCPTASWAVWKQTGEPAKFRDYGWFNAEEEGRYCRRCGTELVKGCRTSSCKKQKIEHRGDLYCGTCGKRFAETTIIAPHELWMRTMDDRKRYTQEQQVELLQTALGRLQDSNFDPPLRLMEELAVCVDGHLLLLENKHRQDGSALKMQSTDLRHLKNLEDIVENSHGLMTSLMSAVRASNQEFFTELEIRLDPDVREARLATWKENRQQKEQEKIAQGLIEPSETGDAAVVVPPPDE